MSRKLNTYVHVGEKRYGPDDEVPAAVAKQITNPDVWAEGSEDDATADEAVPAVPGERPPTSGAGSGRDAWEAYARSQGVEVTEDMNRDAIVAAVDNRA